MSLIGNRGLPTTRMLSVGRETGIAVLGRVATMGRADLVGCFCSPLRGMLRHYRCSGWAVTSFFLKRNRNL